jgi:hypothetical protein
MQVIRRENEEYNFFILVLTAPVRGQLYLRTQTRDQQALV